MYIYKKILNGKVDIDDPPKNDITHPKNGYYRPIQKMEPTCF